MKNNKTDLEKIIKQKLFHNYFLSSEEIKDVLSKLKYTPYDELQNLIKILNEGEAKQDEILKALNEADPNFNENLKSFLKKEYREITKEVEKEEKEGAETLLDDLKNL